MCCFVQPLGPRFEGKNGRQNSVASFEKIDTDELVDVQELEESLHEKDGFRSAVVQKNDTAEKLLLVKIKELGKNVEKDQNETLKGNCIPNVNQADGVVDLKVSNKILVKPKRRN